MDAQSGLVQKVIGTAANLSEISQSHELLHGNGKYVFADTGYIGVEKHTEIALRITQPRWHIAAIRALPEGYSKALTQELEKIKARVRARVEHPSQIIKNLFRHRKTRYRGLAKNTVQLHSLFALANLILARRTFALSVYP